MDTASYNNTANLSLDVSSLSISNTSTFSPPTNQASKTSYNASKSPSRSPSIPGEHLIVSDGNFSLTSTATYSPWLPISKGNIKKLAQTRFVNSSPNSYRLMPASAEASESDRTSFVEKSSHKFSLPVSYFLEVAKLWALSNQSELECTFTLAKTDDLNTTSALKALTDNDKKRPICHSKASSSPAISNNSLSTERTSAENELLHSLNRFLKSCEKKDRAYVLNHGIYDSAGSETRRYLSQVVSLMNKTFACKLKNGFTVTSHSGEVQSRKRSLPAHNGDYQRKRTKEETTVNIFTMPSSTEPTESEEDKIVIIHIPPSQRNKDKIIHKPSLENVALSNSDTTISEKFHKCFYCNLCFEEKQICAKHMLSHLTSHIQD